MHLLRFHVSFTHLKRPFCVDYALWYEKRPALFSLPVTIVAEKSFLVTCKVELKNTLLFIYIPLWNVMHNLFTHLSLQEIARGGISVSAVFNYRITPQVSTEVCYTNSPITINNCIVMYHEWPDNRIVIDTWYQTRSLKWCRSSWGISYVSLCMYSLVTRPIGCRSGKGY